MEKHLSSVECMLVRETMVRQEKMYREQVQALHYLYEVQKTLMEERLSKNYGSPQLQAPAPRDHQFFPVKSESERVTRNFDLEKLPDECGDEQQQQPDVKTRLIDLNTTCNGDADVELVLNCGTLPKRPRYGNPDNVQDLKASLQQQHQQNSQDFLTGLNSQSQNGSKNQPHWLLEDSRKPDFYSWNHLKQNAGLFPHGNSSWFTQEPSQTPPPPRLWNNGLAFGPVDGMTAPWYNHQLSSATHPWQASAAAYYTGAPYSPFISPANGLTNGLANGLANGFSNGFTNGFPNGISASTITSTKTPYKSSPDAAELGLYLQQQQTQKNGRHSNGYSSALLDSLMAREMTEGYRAGLLSDRNFYRDNSHTSKACNLETRFLTLTSEAQQSYWNHVGASNVNAWRSSESDAQVELSLVATRPAVVEDESINLAASTLLSLSLDTTVCSSKENSPPLLKKSVQWFAEAIPTEGEEEQEVEKSVETSEEVDEFEMACLQLQLCKLEDYAPIRVDAILETVLSPRNKTASGRPKRVGKKQRDFRNDTLPSITSLSRQEITEDFQIMSGLMRSTRDQLQPDSTGVAVGASSSSQARRGSKTCNGRQVGSTVEVNKTGSGGTGSSGAGTGSLPWLVSWGESTRRKRQQRQRSAALPPVSRKLTVLNSTVTTRARR